MLELNRTAIVVRPKQTFVDWLNTHPDLDLQEDPISPELLQQYSRELNHLIWMRGKSGERLEVEDARIYKAMRQHPEYHMLWDHLDQISQAELERGGVNPLVHIHMHTTVEAQLERRDPPEVEAAMKALLRRGRTRHQAIHAVGALVADQLYSLLAENRPFDLQGYVDELKKLIKGR